MVRSEAKPEHESFLLVVFHHGANESSQERYTDWDQDFLGHSSQPQMEVVLPSNKGTFDDSELRIVLPIDPFVDRASSGVPHSPIFVTVNEVTQGLESGDQNTQRQVFAGRVVRSVKNYQGVSGSAAFFVMLPKSRLDVPMGLPCTYHCAWTLFGRGCELSQASFQQSAQIDSVDGYEATITTAGVVAQVGTYWRRGYMIVDGLRIGIREWSDAAPTKFRMTRRAPNDWILAGANSILLIPGCDKTIETCRARWSNEEHFSGLGYAIPPYSPNFESPG